MNGGKLNWWQTRWFVAAMALLAAVPLLWPTVPPLVDLRGIWGGIASSWNMPTSPGWRIGIASNGR